MQDHDFEKQVHQKMEEMKILPSDAVWKEVERRLHPKSKKRPWIWIPFLFIALGIGGYLMYTNKPASQLSGQPGADLSIPGGNALNDSKDNTQPGEELTKTAPYTKHDTIEITALSTAKKEEHTSGKDKKPATAGQLSLTAPAAHTGRYVNKTGEPKTNSFPQNTGMNRNTRDDVLENVPKTILPLHQTETFSSGLPGHKTGDGSGSMMITKEPVPASIHSSIAPSEPFNTSLAVRDLQVAVHPPVIKQQKHSGWEWGFSVQAGQSGITNGKFTSLFTREAVADMNNSFTSGNQPLTPTAIYVPPSSLKPGPGFSAGVLVKKQLTKRTSISAGLQYTRFTTSHKVGTRVTDSVLLLQSNSVADQKAVRNYYRLGNTGNYINRYHFIELPVLIETRLTGSRFLPVYWNLGISYSRMVSSNALHFDGSSRIYYRNNSLFNRNQFNFITGLPVRILQAERYSLKAGPVFQYGLSNQMNKAASGSRHLLFVGVKADITLFK